MCSMSFNREQQAKDILDRLRPLLELGPDCSIPMGGEARGLVTDVIDEIERLRSLAGAVTPGPSFAEIKRGS